MAKPPTHRTCEIDSGSDGSAVSKPRRCNVGVQSFQCEPEGAGYRAKRVVSQADTHTAPHVVTFIPHETGVDRLSLDKGG